MRHDLPNEWQLFKTNGAIDLTIDKSRLPYMAQTPTADIGNVIFLAKIKDNPSTFTISIDATPINLAKIEKWNLCRGDSPDIDLGTSFAISVDPTLLDKLEDLMMVVKFVS